MAANREKRLEELVRLLTAVRLAEVSSWELRAIDRALNRARVGKYGECEDCGKSIPLSRLNALPYAVRCVGCQRQFEVDNGSPADEIDWNRLFGDS